MRHIRGIVAVALLSGVFGFSVRGCQQLQRDDVDAEIRATRQIHSKSGGCQSGERHQRHRAADGAQAVCALAYLNVYV